jgi:hypothetical protein
LTPAKGHSKEGHGELYQKSVLSALKGIYLSNFFYQQNVYLNPSMASGQPPKIVQRHMAYKYLVIFEV